MTEIYRHELRHPEPQQDLSPDANKGLNWGQAGPHPERNNARTAHDVKEAHRLLADFNDAELEQIRLMPPGSRLESNATYIDLKDAERREFTAEGVEEVIDGDLIVPKSEIHYELWNRLRRVEHGTAGRTSRGELFAPSPRGSAICCLTSANLPKRNREIIRSRGRL
jgi:hypothetical protein